MLELLLRIMSTTSRETSSLVPVNGVKDMKIARRQLAGSGFHRTRAILASRWACRLVRGRTDYETTRD